MTFQTIKGFLTKLENISEDGRLKDRIGTNVKYIYLLDYKKDCFYHFVYICILKMKKLLILQVQHYQHGQAGP